jgi:hypothetical protein
MIVPITTVLGISAFRYGHYLERQLGFHLGAYFLAVTVLTFAFQTWYLFFGLSLIKKYFFREMPKEYHISQWGLVCPFVAYAVMGSFVYANFIPSVFLLGLIIFLNFLFIGLYFYLLFKQFRCHGLNTDDAKSFCMDNALFPKLAARK